MTTLQIEHEVTDFPTWSKAFAQFAEVRKQAGVRGHRVRRPVDHGRYVLVELDFDEGNAAESFLEFLRSHVWNSSPVLVGDPQARIVESVPGGLA